jgi:integral membrane protein
MNKLTAFRWIANLEGISFLLLLLIAMPLKYIWQQPWLTQQVGMAHGVLFVGYIIAVLAVRKELAWSNKQVMLAMFLSFVPFGTFYVTGKMMDRAYE